MSAAVSVIQRKPMMSPELPAEMTFESMAERLRDGPLRTLLTLQVRAGVVSGDTEGDACQRLEMLVDLVQLARMAMAQFQAFTRDLQGLVDDLAAATGKLL